MIAIWFAHQDIPPDVDGAGVYFRMVDLAQQPDEFREKVTNDFVNGMTGAAEFEPTHLPDFSVLKLWAYIRKMQFLKSKNSDH